VSEVLVKMTLILKSRFLAVMLHWRWFRH